MTDKPMDEFELNSLIDATILGVLHHPDLRKLSIATQRDVAKMIKTLGQASERATMERVVKKLREWQDMYIELEWWEAENAICEAADRIENEGG